MPATVLFVCNIAPTLNTARSGRGQCPTGACELTVKVLFQLIGADAGSKYSSKVSNVNIMNVLRSVRRPPIEDADRSSLSSRSGYQLSKLARTVNPGGES